MKIVVCVRQLTNGELNPFDACAYEAALSVPGAETVLLSMGAPQTADCLRGLSRLGARRAVLLSDGAFAGADTLATAYTLSLAVKKLAPTLVFCGRQALEGDTAQTGAMLAEMLGAEMPASVVRWEIRGETLAAADHDGTETLFPLTEAPGRPAVLAFERVQTLRLPRLGSRPCEVETWDAAMLGADRARCGLRGSATRVTASRENTAGRRHCRFISPGELLGVIAAARAQALPAPPAAAPGAERLPLVMAVGHAARAQAEALGARAENIPLTADSTPQTLADAITAAAPDAVLWGDRGKTLAARTAARLGLGLCADCTGFNVREGVLHLIRPARCGSIMADIICLTRPAMATVRTAEDLQEDLVIAIGWGARAVIPEIRAWAAALNGTLAASRKMVDNDLLPHSLQVGLTGRTVRPPVYLAVGISGAVHHLAGMRGAGTVIAVNPDREAPVFEYADYGVLAPIEEVLAGK